MRVSFGMTAFVYCENIVFIHEWSNDLFHRKKDQEKRKLS